MWLLFQQRSKLYDDFFDGVVLLYHLLMVAAALLGRSALHEAAHLGVHRTLGPHGRALVVL